MGSLGAKEPKDSANHAKGLFHVFTEFWFSSVHRTREEKNPNLTPYPILTLVKVLIDLSVQRYLGIPSSFQTGKFTGPLSSVSL